jgi:diacylglycerol O-acyltransferase / wax synthase
VERLTGLDATFLYLETPTQHLHVCAVFVIDPATMPGGYSFEKIKKMFETRLDLVPPFRRRLQSVPMNLDHPIWVEDEHFDLDYHVRRIGCPAPGGEEQLAELAADIASRPLDRSRPLWEMWVIEGLENGYVGVVGKMHHCTVDGVSGANLMVNLLDLEADPPVRHASEWTPERTPSELELLGRAVINRLARPAHVARMIPRTVGALTRLVRARRSSTYPSYPAPLTAPRTAFNGAITAHRKVAFNRVSLDEVKDLKRRFDCTVNDVVLAVAAGALRRYLKQTEDLPDKPLIATCPVSVRTDEERATVGSNKVSAIFTALPTNIEDPVLRLREIQAINKGSKEIHNAVGAQMLQDWAEFAAPTTFSLAARLVTTLQIPQRAPVVHNLVISNVPGPSFPLYFAGAKLVALYPLGPVFEQAALNITVLSYMDSIYWGFIACRESAPRLWELAAAVSEALAELQKAADRVTP